MADCELKPYTSNQDFLGKSNTFCNVKTCPYKHLIEGEFEGNKYGICSTHGEVEETGRISESEIESIAQQSQSAT